MLSTEEIFRLRQLHCLPGGALLSRVDAALYLDVSVHTLELWARIDKDKAAAIPDSTSRPVLCVTQIGGLSKYTKSDLDEFIRGRRSAATRSGTGIEDVL